MKKPLLTLITLAMLFAACSKKDATPNYQIDQSAISLNYDDTHQYEIKQESTRVDPATVAWKSSDPLIGTISTTGLFHAKMIGKTTVSAQIGDKVLSSEITITPYTTFFTEPLIDFNASKATVKAWEKRTIAQGGESDEGLIYAGDNSKLRFVGYSFKSGVLEFPFVLFVNENEALIAETITYYSERYTYEGEEDNVLIFSNSNLLIILSYTKELGFNAIYTKNATGKTGSITDFKELKKMYHDDLKLPKYQFLGH